MINLQFPPAAINCRPINMQSTVKFGDAAVIMAKAETNSRDDCHTILRPIKSEETPPRIAPIMEPTKAEVRIIGGYFTDH